MKFALNIRSKSYIERYNNNDDVNDLQFSRACTSNFFLLILAHIFDAKLNRDYAISHLFH